MLLSYKSLVLIEFYSKWESSKKTAYVLVRLIVFADGFRKLLRTFVHWHDGSYCCFGYNTCCHCKNFMPGRISTTSIGCRGF